MAKTNLGKSILLTGANQNFRAQSAKDLATANSSDFDIFVFDTKEQKGIDTVREITSLLSRKPYQSQLTSVIILEAQKLTNEAQNSLLKILEEPNESSQLILVSPSRDLLLPTVASRLSEISLRLPKETVAKEQNANNWLTQNFSNQLNFIEKTSREDYLDYWSNKFDQTAKHGSNDLKSIHRYNKLILKMLRAEKGLVNKKLIDLILALEIPNRD